MGLSWEESSGYSVDRRRLLELTGGLYPAATYRVEFLHKGGAVDESDFEGTLVLEKLAEIGKVDEFFEAIDSDDFGRAKALMKRARIDLKTIEVVIKKMSDGEH